MIITTIADFSLQYDEPLGLLRAEWSSGDDLRTFRSSATQCLQLVQELGVRNILLNMNTFPDIPVYDQLWLGTHWLSGVVPLAMERVVIVNHRRRVHNQMAIDALIILARPFIGFDIQYFPQPVAGLHWLSDFSPRLPALLAEWDAVHGPAMLPSAVGSQVAGSGRPLGHAGRE